MEPSSSPDTVNTADTASAISAEAVVSTAQASPNTSTTQEEQLSDTNRFSSLHILIFVVAAGILLVLAAFLAAKIFLSQNTKQQLLSILPLSFNQEVSPQKEALSQKLPDDFPKNILINKTGDLYQNYMLDYGKDKQMVVTFFSSGSVEENGKAYDTFLKQDGWKISGSQIGSIVSSFHASKNNTFINISINRENNSTTTSQVLLDVAIKEEKSQKIR